jgi:hypothetical protein
VIVACTGIVFGSCGAPDAPAIKLPAGYLSEKQSQEILDKTMTIRLDPDLSHLDEAELEVIEVLLQLGEIVQTLYEVSRHNQALSSYRALIGLDNEFGHPKATQNLIDLYRLFKGPVARNLNGDFVPFLPVNPKAPGKNVYPLGVTKKEIEDFLSSYPDKRERLLDLRTVVRLATAENVARDLGAADQDRAVLGFLHPGVYAELDALAPLAEGDGESGYYAVPYALAYADEMLKAHELLTAAADVIERVDIDFSRYLRHRALDLLKNNYEAGDAAWVTGRFGNLNAQIGSYETYDDELFGVKSFFGVSILVKDTAMDSSLNAAIGWLQEFEDKLPYDRPKRVRNDIPVGVYNVVADFGQPRGTNTATILPNESYITKKYGRTILLRRNILENPGIFSARENAYQAAVATEFHSSYTPEGDFYRTMFHEIGHYLGPDADRNGRNLDIVLEEDSSIMEELKADLVSLYLARPLQGKGYYDEGRLRAVQAAGIRRVLLKNRPRKSQVYATMQLMQMNYFLRKGLLEYDASQNQLLIHFEQYHRAVESMLREVLALQSNGDKADADRFIERYSTWEENPHGSIADSMKKAEEYRYGLVRYAALGE